MAAAIWHFATGAKPTHTYDNVNNKDAGPFLDFCERLFAIALPSYAAAPAIRGSVYGTNGVTLDRDILDKLAYLGD